MSLSKAIYKILSSETDLIAETSTRIFPSVIPQNVDYPALMYEINSQDPIYVKDRRHEKTEAHIVIGVHGKTYADTQNISDIVIATLEKYKNATTKLAPTAISGTPYAAGCSIVEGYWIQEIFFDNSFDLFDEKLRVFEKYIEFDVRFIVNPGSMGAYGWYAGEFQDLVSTSTTVPIPPTSGSSIAQWYDASGATSLNLLDEATLNPKWYSGSYVEFSMANDSALGSASAKTFDNGNTIFFVFQIADPSYSYYSGYLMNDTTDDVNANSIKIQKFVGGSNSLYFNINGNQTTVSVGSDISFENKVYLAFSWGGSSDESGEWSFIDSATDNYWDDPNLYESFTDADAGDFKFQYLTSNIGGSSADLRLYDVVIFDKKLTFGGGQYKRIRDYLLNKNGL